MDVTRCGDNLLFDCDNGEILYDFRRKRIAGAVVTGVVRRIGHDPPPAGTFESVAVIFTNLDTAHQVTVYAASQTWTYEAFLVPGRYGVSVSSGLLPKGEIVVHDALTAAAETRSSLDLDIPLLSLRGTLASNGTLLPAERCDRDTLVFATAQTNESVRVECKDGWPFSVKLGPGRYRVEQVGGQHWDTILLATDFDVSADNDDIRFDVPELAARWKPR
jgi:hypothetical protein